MSFHVEDEAGRKIERIPSGATTNLIFGYETRDGKEAKNIEIGILVERSGVSELSSLARGLRDKTFAAYLQRDTFHAR